MAAPSFREPSSGRRSFLKVAIHALSALVAVVLGVPALAYLLDARHRAAAQGDFRSAARLDELPLNTPHQVVLRDVRRDAWTLHPNDVIGRVWLIRRDRDRVEAFTTICPHLGCSVNFEDKAQHFVCPCHGGTFDRDGRRVDTPGQINPAPRGMDRLECRRCPTNADLIEVKYQNFMQGKPVATPKT